MAAPLIIRPGTEVGGYTLESMLGAGGFGAVYRARRGGRLYALKLQRLEHVGGWAEREVALLLRLKHRHVVRFQGCGYWPEEAPRFLYLLMEHVEGQQLDAWAEAERPGAREVAVKALHVARALAAVHAARALHRDVKEANVLVRREDGAAVLVDFGAGDYEGAPGLTRSMLPPGTAEYRAPEVWRFLQEHSGDVRARYAAGPMDDVYALGVVLYRLLTGVYPHGDGPGEDWMERRGQQAPTAPQVLNSRVPVVLGELCLALLAPRPEDRPPGAKAVCKALEAALSGADASWEVPLHGAAEPPGTPEQAPAPGKPVPEHEPAPAVPARPHTVWRWVLAMAAGLCALLLWQWHREVAAPPNAPEAVRAAAPRSEDRTPAAAATPAVRSKDEASVKQQATNTRTLLATTCLAMGTACASGPQFRPPPPEPCPAGAVEAMKPMDIYPGDIGSASLLGGDDSRTILVREGQATLEVTGPWRGMPSKTLLFGRLYLGEKHVYGRFTQARTPDSRQFPVCIELGDVDGGRGALREPGDEGPGTARIFTLVSVLAAEHFE